LCHTTSRYPVVPHAEDLPVPHARLAHDALHQARVVAQELADALETVRRPCRRAAAGAIRAAAGAIRAAAGTLRPAALVLLAVHSGSSLVATPLAVAQWYRLRGAPTWVYLVDAPPTESWMPFADTMPTHHLQI
jgi:hypothetical protein